MIEAPSKGSVVHVIGLLVRDPFGTVKGTDLIKYVPIRNSLRPLKEADQPTPHTQLA